MKPTESANGNHQIRKKKLPLLLTSFAIHCLTKATAFVPQCETYGISKWEPSNRIKKLPLLLTSFAIHCLTKASAFVPQCENIGNHIIGNHHCAKKKLPLLLAALAIHCLTKSHRFLFPNAKTSETI